MNYIYIAALSGLCLGYLAGRIDSFIGIRKRRKVSKMYFPDRAYYDATKKLLTMTFGDNSRSYIRQDHTWVKMSTRAVVDVPTSRMLYDILRSLGHSV